METMKKDFLKASSCGFLVWPGAVSVNKKLLWSALAPAIMQYFFGGCVGMLAASVFFPRAFLQLCASQWNDRRLGPVRLSAGEDRRQRGLLTSREGRRDPVATEGRGANSALDGDAEVTPPPAPPAATGGSVDGGRHAGGARGDQELHVWTQNRRT